jgi:citrate lyase beta subunit/acyl dehydratase
MVCEGNALWSEVVSAFGGDEDSARAELEERLGALKRIDPAASPEAVVERLAWELRPRTIEHVFPGDNWYFLLKAAQSQAHILLLDIEDAVATTRKEIARPVIVLLLRAFRGLPLTGDELDFLAANAMPEGRSGQLREVFESFREGFRLKASFRFPPNQMILVRPNNLRTAWAAGDYLEVIREAGELIDGIYLPKIEEAEDVRVAVSILRAIQAHRGWAPGRHKVFVLTELPGAILQAREILSVAPEVEEINLGVVDYTAATGGRSIVQQEQFTYMRFALLTIVEAARATGKVAGTGITVRLEADETEKDTLLAQALGIHRKWSVHPAHIEGIARRAEGFPRPVRKRLTYEPIEPFDLEELEALARQGRPILPPKVFIPRPVVLARSVVEARADDPEALERALASGADMVLLNLEGLEQEAQRPRLASVADALERMEDTGPAVVCQADLFGPESAGFLKVLLEALGRRLQGLILADVQDARQVREASGLLTEAERQVGLASGSIPLGARLSRPEAVEAKAHEIAEASRRLMWLLLDLPPAMPKEALDDPSTKGYHYYHSALIAAAAHADVDALAGPSPPDRVEAEALFAANLGFHGKVVEPKDVALVAAIMSPPRAGEAPEEPRGPEAEAFRARWTNSVERALEILELYATADQERQLGAVAYNDPVSGQAELVDAATARIYYRQLERALKAGHLSAAETERYLLARQRLLLALRPGGREIAAWSLFAGQRITGHALTIRDWMVRAFAKSSGDRNRYHLDRAYACSSRFGRLVAHGLLTTSVMLAHMGQILSVYSEEALSVRFKAPVAFGDTLTPEAEVLEVSDEGGARIRLWAVNQEGVVVCEGEARLKPKERHEPYVLEPEEIGWLKRWAEDVEASIPDRVYDFTDPSSPRLQTFTKPVGADVVRATRALFGGPDSQRLSRLIALGAMAQASAEAAPGHLLLSAEVSRFGVPVAEGDLLSLTVRAPEASSIRRSKKGKGPPIVPLAIEVVNQRGETVLEGEVVKLMEEAP